MPQPSPRLSKYEITGYVLIIVGAVILVWGTIKFNLTEELYSSPADREGVFGQYGEFIGGIVGSLWALAGVFLFFATLTYQKREFELQRFELHKTQRIYQQQHFSTLFLSFIQKHNDIIDSLIAYDIKESEWKGANFFVFFQERVLTSFVQKVRNLNPQERTEPELYRIFRDYFTYHFTFYQNALNPYLRNLTILLKLIQKYKAETQDAGEYYSFITKANLTPYELFLLYHVAEFELLTEPGFSSHTLEIFDQLPATYKAGHIIHQELQAK